MNDNRKPVARYVVALFFTGVLLTHQIGYTQPTPLPAAPIRPVVDDYFGTKITDPYRWMEDMKNPELLNWMKAQADYTRLVLDNVPGRQAVLARLTELSNAVPARVSNVMRLPGERYVYLKINANENGASLCIRQGLGGTETRLVDPAQLKPSNGQPVSISYFQPSWDGKLIAVGLAAGGSENTYIRIIDVLTGYETGETIDRARYGGVAWLPDSRSFFYTRLQQLPPDAPNTERQQKSRVYQHVVGTSAEQDRIVFGHGVDPAVDVPPTLIPRLHTYPNTDYVLASVISGVGGAKTGYVVSLSAVGKTGVDTPWRKLFGPADDITDAAPHGDDLYLVTHKNTPRYKVIRTSLQHPDLAMATDVLPAGKAVISGGYVAGEGALHLAQDALYVQQLDGGLGRIRRIPFQKTESPSDVPLPFEGTLFDVRADSRLPGLLLSLTSWTKTARPLAYDPARQRTHEVGLQPNDPHDKLTSTMAVREVNVPATDGTLIPLSIMFKKGLTLDGTHPTWLNGYGAYGIPSLSGTSPMITAWVEQGGIYAVAHVRGGGEYGEEWHKGGYKATKPNTWRDFIACAEYLIAQQYTSSKHLGGLGISAGGILMGRAMTERPDLFRAVGIAVGLTDMLRYETTANGVPNIPEFGSVKTEEGFKILHEMSAYHHVSDSTNYPAVMLGTGINDPRVDPWLMAKMTARLQAASRSGHPVMLRVDYQSGHGPGVTKQQRLTTFADAIAFLFWQLGHPGFQPVQATKHTD
ncbi:prolyl oligopeptidase family serine peptidase [Fibrella aquatilis]|uniref:prolyl oligopeptidase n=1 Tax=Fibrella aquatilis TaxID=2817059 RepID=A0A939G4L1_9BACT|nr:prolyl oligopeptidase family serine peptidase [Fibrella aquatilis]MBO0931786.1 S9 family peptidase [Fibrella aquatilis]